MYYICKITILKNVFQTNALLQYILYIFFNLKIYLILKTAHTRYNDF